MTIPTPSWLGKPPRQFPWATAHIAIESCERRLVLSAQLLFDVLGDQALELHADPIPIDTHLREAHAASGWNDVQQQFGLTGRGQTVAVIDSGIAWDHVALGQGYGPGYRVVGGWDFTEENDAQPYDDGPMGFHGTHVSGIIGARNATHSGVAPDVDLVALRVFNDMGQGQLSWVERALQWVHDHRNSFANPITTVNLSLGTTWNADVVPNWATLEDELKALYDDGIVVSASAGNSFQQYKAAGLSYPAASPYVIPVASVDDQGQLSSFSQRSGRALAAPGSNIMSTVPDHVLGRDGVYDDYSSASGTSMAAPYVAGASVLVRQAMEMVGLAGINTASIAQHLHATADSVFDTFTNSSYDRLNLQRAIDTLIPDDQVGDTLQTASRLSLTENQLDGWLNTLNDRDVYRFTAPASGTLHLDADSKWIDSLRWDLRSGGQSIGSGGLDPAQFNLVAGQSYELVVSADQEIGDFSLDYRFAAQPGSGSGGQGGLPPVGGPAVDLGPITYLQESYSGGSHLRVQAERDGLFTVQWTNHTQPLGGLSVSTGAAPSIVDNSWAANELRVDVPVTAGQWVNIRLPGGSFDQGELVLANVLSQAGSRIDVRGTLNHDTLGVDLQNGLKLQFGEIVYSFPAGTIRELHVDGAGSNDSVHIVGSTRSDKVDLRPTGSTLSNPDIAVHIASVEEVYYASGGGPDRVYLYDSNGDDTLRARPGSAELLGVGYRFEVQQVERIFIHATGGGQDYAYLYDSSGNDQLSVRPQFSSMSGDGFFNYVRGFERVYAYANAGGVDRADLYDSSGADRFLTSGVSASIVGPGFSSFTRSFEEVRAHADAGGADVATLYGSGARTQWQQGSDFVSFREDGWNREARGFPSVETYVAGQPHGMGKFASSSLPMQALHQATPPTDQVAEQAGNSANISAGDTPSIQAAATPWLHSDRQESGFAQAELLQPSEQLQTESTSGWQRLSEPPATAWHPELQTLRDARGLSSWLHERLALPEEALLSDPELELSLLDDVFGRL